jgi:precorrin-3B methylase
MSSRFEIKDNMYMSQMHIMEEESNLLKARLQEEKERAHEALETAKEEIDNIKA